MDEPRVPRRLVAQPIDLDRLVGNDEVWKAIVGIAAALRPDEWALVGGQMVALHGFVSGVTPSRVTDDIDIVADVAVRRGVLSRYAGDASTPSSSQPDPLRVSVGFRYAPDVSVGGSPKIGVLTQSGAAVHHGGVCC